MFTKDLVAFGWVSARLWVPGFFGSLQLPPFVGALQLLRFKNPKSWALGVYQGLGGFRLGIPPVYGCLGLILPPEVWLDQGHLRCLRVPVGPVFGCIFSPHRPLRMQRL